MSPFPSRPTCRLAVLLLALACLCPESVLAQSPGVVTGRVTGADDGQPVSGATVSILELGVSTSSDRLGRFVLGRIPAGEYEVRAEALGYRPRTASVAVTGAGTPRVEIELPVSPLELPGIVVTNEKFVRNLQETRTSVHVTHAEIIEEFRIVDWRDMARQVANFSPGSFGDFQIRGVSNQGVGFGGNGPVAQIYLDGMPQSSQAVRFGTRGLWDVESVEVFRGPQSTVSGRNALAGAVHVRSKDPEFSWGGAARLAGGTLEARELAGMVTGPLVEDQLAFRVSGEYQLQDTDFRYPVLSEEFDDLDVLEEAEYRSINGRLLFTPSALPRFAARISYVYSFDRPQNLQRATGPDLEERVTDRPFAAVFEGEVQNAALEMTWDLTDRIRLTSHSGFHRTERSRDGLTYVLPDVFSPDGLVGTFLQDDLQQELRANYESEGVRAVLGVYAIGADFENDNRILANVQEIAGAPIPVIYDADALLLSTTTNRAVFGEVNVDLTDRLEVTVGARYDTESLDVESRTQATLTSSNPDLLPDEALPEIPDELFELETDYEAFLPKLGATVELTDDVALGASVQRGYRAGGAEVLPTGETNTFDPEYTWNYEVSLRSRLAGDRLMANANLFYTDWTDQQLNIPLADAPGLFRTENAGSSTLRGGELELRALPGPGLSLFASVGIVQTEFEEFTLVRGGEVVDFAGNEFPRSVGEQLAVGGSWEPRGGALEGLTLSTDIAWTGEYFSDPENTPALTAGGYTEVGGRIGWAFDWAGTSGTLSLFGRNLLDEDIVMEVDRSAVSGRGVFFGRPRVVGVALDLDLR
jgi:outer membrane receptor protein involved in Fe transport